MLQADAVQFNFPPPLTFAEALEAILLWWLIGLLLIAFGTRFIYPDKSGWLNLLAVAALALGFLASLLLGFSFTRLNHHPLIVWTPDNHALNHWIGLSVGLTIWISAPFAVWATRKQRQWRTPQSKLHAN
jgi:hypothetical protein